MRTFAIGVILLVGPLLSGDPVRAQEQVLCPPVLSGGGLATADSAADADIIIRASVHADELRFSSQPRVNARLTGCAVLDTIRVTERRNLPRPLQPNVTYRDVYVAVEILGHLNAQCLLQGLLGADSTAVAGAPPSVCARTDASTPPLPAGVR